MPTAEPQFDGFEGIHGISGARYDQIPTGLCQNAFNRAFRFGRNRTRPPLVNLPLTFASQADQFLFEGGNFQGAFIYESYPTFQNSYLFASIAGTIFQIQLTGQVGAVTRFFDGNEPTFQHAWFVQGFNWMVIQDGLSLPIVWDGTNPPRRSNPGPPVTTGGPGNEIPVGSVMAFNQGYIIVCSSDGTNQIAVSDQVYSNPSFPYPSTQALITFAYKGPGENPIGFPIFQGDINGLFSMPYLDTGTGQNELIVAGTDGLVSIDLSGQRDTWIDTQIIRISLVGIGCYSSHSLCSLNGDLFFRNTDGIYSYRNSRLEFQSTWNQAPISLDVRTWLDQDRPDLVQFNQQISWNNYLFSTVYPVIFPPNNPLAGFHRCFRGILVMDCEPESTVSRQGQPIWNGVWTGLRTTAMVEGRLGLQHRAFAFSYDADGVNRLYELSKTGLDDTFEGSPVPIKSFFDSANIGNEQGLTNNFLPKVVGSAELELSNLQEPVQIDISLRPDSSPCYVPITTYTAGCGCFVPPAVPCLTFSQPSYDRRVTSGLDGKCIPGTGLPLSNLRHWQARIAMTGFAEVERMRWSFKPNPDRENQAMCQTPACRPTLCCPYGDAFSYSIAPVGVNPNVPFIPTPSDVATSYTSTQFFTAQCPDGTGKVMVSASATSTISQNDADAQALNLARQRAIAQLKCSTCATAVFVTFSVQNSTFDLSTFFATGYGSSYLGQQWRLIDDHTLTIYASGNIDGTGTLIVLYALTTGTDTFDPVTKIFTDSSGTLTPVSLEIGCGGTGETIWPVTPTY